MHVWRYKKLPIRKITGKVVSYVKGALNTLVSRSRLIIFACTTLLQVASSVLISDNLDEERLNSPGLEHSLNDYRKIRGRLAADNFFNGVELTN